MLNIPWYDAILVVASDFDAAGIPYWYDASTALFLQGLHTPEMDDVDVTVPWVYIEPAQALFSKYDPTPISRSDGMAMFRFTCQAVPIHALSYMGSDVAQDRVAVIHDGCRLWCKPLDFFYRHYEPGHPRRHLIEDFMNKRNR